MSDCNECELNSLSERTNQLETKLFESEAYQIHRLYFADKGVKRLTTDKLRGGGVILTVHSLGGEELVGPVLISDGLSDDTIQGLRKDFARSYEHRIELKPGLVGKDKGNTGE